MFKCTDETVGNIFSSNHFSIVIENSMQGSTKETSNNKLISEDLSFYDLHKER